MHLRGFNLIRNVYIISDEGSIIFSKNYSDNNNNTDLIEFLISLTEFVNNMNFPEKTETMGMHSLQLYYLRKGNVMFYFVADKSDDPEQVKEKIEQLSDIFMEKWGNIVKNWSGDPNEFEGIEEVVDKIAVTMVKIALLGFSSVGKTTTLRLLRGEPVALTHKATIGVNIKSLSSDIGNANLVIWDLAGQSRFSILWNKMVKNAQVVIIVTDSTLENVLRSRKLVQMVQKEAPTAKIIGIANKQDLPTALTPERVGQILGVPTYELIAIDPSYRDRLLAILTKAILEVSST